jgi:hypothetical protein
MFGLILFLSCTAFCAWRATAWLAAREPEPITPVERGIWTGVLGLGLWLAQGHLLAFAGLFRPAWLLAFSCSLALIAIALHGRPVMPSWASIGAPFDAPRRLAVMLHRPVALGTVLPLALVAMCLIYSAAALSVLPVSNHDALSYHFPKAVRLMTTGAFGLYPSEDLRVTYFPGNYETLVATLLAFLRSDTATGLITTASLLLFLAGSFAFLKRVWRTTSIAALALPMMLASPVLFLHVTAHKNDLLMGAVTFSALVWIGRFAVQGGAGSAVVGMAALGLAVGTKIHGLFAVLASTLLFWRAWRGGVWRPSPASAARQAAAAAALFMVLGGAQYLANLAATGHLQGILQIATPNAVNTVAYPAYWQVPRFIWMFLAAPFVIDGQYFHVPWNDELWFWPGYELYFSHYGRHVTLLILMLPLGAWWTRRQTDARLRELSGVSLAALVLVGLNLLIGLRPYGSFSFIPRFLFFALPVLMAWTWCPGVKRLQQTRHLAWLPIAVSLVIPVAYIGATVANDAFTPLGRVTLLWNRPDRRRDIFHSPWRAAAAVDRLAAANATIAIDAGYDGWTYPLYGARLSRNVETILSDPAPYQPGPEVDWVVVDRAFSIVWGHPGFQSMSQARRYIDRGPLTDADQRVYRSLVKNPDFERVYFYPSRFQAVFRRIRPRVAAMLDDSRTR